MSDTFIISTICGFFFLGLGLFITLVVLASFMSSSIKIKRELQNLMWSEQNRSARHDYMTVLKYQKLNKELMTDNSRMSEVIKIQTKDVQDLGEAKLRLNRINETLASENERLKHLNADFEVKILALERAVGR